MFEDVHNRKYFRVAMKNPVEVNLSLCRLKGMHLEQKKFAPIVLIDISAGGICFFSDIKFPIGQDVLYFTQIKMLNKQFDLFGNIVRIKVFDENYFEYGLQFRMDDQELFSSFFEFVSKLQIHLHKHENFQSYSDDKIKELWDKKKELTI